LLLARTSPQKVLPVSGGTFVHRDGLAPLAFIDSSDGGIPSIVVNLVCGAHSLANKRFNATNARICLYADIVRLHLRFYLSESLLRIQVRQPALQYDLPQGPFPLLRLPSQYGNLRIPLCQVGSQLPNKWHCALTGNNPFYKLIVC
jgi:hypothetical protein